MNRANFLLHGQHDPPRAPVALRAGPLSLLYEPGSGFLRRIMLGQREVLRGIYAAVRDRNWGTVPGQVREIRREAGPDGFRIEFESAHCQGGIHFVWRGTIRGEPAGVLRYEFDGEARTAFLRNRIGFCVLHPIAECAGGAARQTMTDGRVVACCFPQFIEPQIFGRSSFRDLRAVAHEVAPDLWAEVEFEGDVFEMEDQRNWTDASFKTYCTPLARPFPVEVQAGARVRQSVTLRLRGALPASPGRVAEVASPGPEWGTLRVPPDAPNQSWPRLGLGIASHSEALTEIELTRLRALQLAHLRVDLHLARPDWPATWTRAVQEASQLGLALELALHLPRVGQADATELHHQLEASPVSVVRVLALREGEPATGPDTLRRVRELFAGRNVPVGAGSDANFCELNREQALGRCAPAEADFVFWTINPQVHATDALSLFETLAAQADTVKTARTFAGGKPLVVSPVTLKQRFNPVATGPEPAPAPGELPAPVDPRQLSLLAAAWTLGSLAALAEAGVAALTFYETTGWRGVMERAGGSLLPEQFPSWPGAVFPVYHLLADLAGAQAVRPLGVRAADGVAAVSVVLADGRRRLLVANQRPTDCPLRLEAAWSRARVRLLHGANVEAALREPEAFRQEPGALRAADKTGFTLTLPPYALARLDAAP
jgi:hypothetical protein